MRGKSQTVINEIKTLSGGFEHLSLRLRAPGACRGWNRGAAPGESTAGGYKWRMKGSPFQSSMAILLQY